MSYFQYIVPRASVERRKIFREGATEKRLKNSTNKLLSGEEETEIKTEK